MKVELAGTNVPVKVLEELLEKLWPKFKDKYKEYKEKLTPEIISAAYAYISRSKKNVDELVDKAAEDTFSTRRSITAILGMGHQSIADHAIFNFNIRDVSRLLVEDIEKRRFGGYTEKSQRYVTLAGDYIKPKEFDKKDLKKFEKLVKLQNDFYSRNNKRLFEYLKKKFSDKINQLKGKEKEDFLKKLEGSAKEDARYSLCLATKAQLGCSYTGQTAELAIRENRYGELKEQKEFSKLLYNEIVKVAPSLIQLADPILFKEYSKGRELKENNFKFTKRNLKKLVEKTFKEKEEFLEIVKSRHLGSFFHFQQPIYEEEVALINHNNPDTQIISAILHKNSKKSISDCYMIASHFSNKNAKIFIKKALKYISEFDKVPREFEAGYLIYEFPLSASCFAQLKRHRMNTLLAQDYDPELDCEIPPNIKEAGIESKLKEVYDKSSNLFYEFKSKYGKASEYVLTNGHRRRVILATNMRQLYHISRTREDIHAQGEIRDKANKMCELAKKVAPETALLLGGKHEFDKIRKEVYG